MAGTLEIWEDAYVAEGTTSAKALGQEYETGRETDTCAETDLKKQGDTEMKRH